MLRTTAINTSNTMNTNLACTLQRAVGEYPRPDNTRHSLLDGRHGRVRRVLPL